MATDPKIPMNYLRGHFEKHGELPKQYKHLTNLFRSPGATASAAVPPLTAAQEKAVREAIGSRQAAGAGNPGASYTDADFQSMIEAYRDKRQCSYVTAFEAVLRTPAGQLAHKAFLKAKNPHIQID